MEGAGCLTGSPITPSSPSTIAKCICPNFQIYLSKLPNEFVEIVNSICPNRKQYLSKVSWKSWKKSNVGAGCPHLRRLLTVPSHKQIDKVK